MEFRDILKRRRMVRAYADEPVARETLEEIVETIRRAPSAGFSQGQRLVVVTEAGRKRALADAVGEEFYVDQGFARWISGAAALVVVCTREQDYHDRYTQPDKIGEGGREIDWPVPYWHVDAGKTAMLVILAAIDAGLVTGVFGVPVERMERARELLALPEDVVIVEVITIGHAAEDTASDEKSSRGTRARRRLEELIHWEQWTPPRRTPPAKAGEPACGRRNRCVRAMREAHRATAPTGTAADRDWSAAAPPACVPATRVPRNP